MESETKKHLAEKILKKQNDLTEWFHYQSQRTPAPFYCSIDLRDSGHKIVPVDSNLYPAGFNNLCPDDLRTAPNLLRSQIEDLLKHHPSSSPKKVLILPEAHTQNTYYLENLSFLLKLVEDAGFEVKLGWYPQFPVTAPTPIALKTFSGKDLTAFPIQIQDHRLFVEDFVPDVILLNNDFSSGYPSQLDTVQQPIVPSHTLGWHSRKKSEHFRFYNELAFEFATILQVDPWFLQIETEVIEPVNFNEDEGTDRVAKSVDRILKKTQEAYSQRKINEQPFVFIKNNSGTYGMGIMVAHSSDELEKMNRRTKNKMSIGKNKLPIRSVVVQEGIPTATLVDHHAAEPVIYLFGFHLIGGFLRTNAEKTIRENLNAPGMVFKKLCMSDLRAGETRDLELVYGSIARISALALAKELAQHARTFQ